MADITVTAADVNRVSGNKVTGTAGATITAGQSLYLDSADNLLKLTDVDSSGKDAVVGVALNGGATGQPITYQKDGELDPGATATQGVIYVASDTAGGICPIADVDAGDKISIIGVGMSNGNISMQIWNTGIATV